MFCGAAGSEDFVAGLLESVEDVEALELIGVEREQHIPTSCFACACLAVVWSVGGASGGFGVLACG